jgi:hypothetical protein
VAGKEKSDSPVQAREQLDALGRNPEGDPAGALKEQVKEQEKQQQEALAAGSVVGGQASNQSDRSLPEQRNAAPGTKPFLGRVDNMTKRNDSEPLEGHFVHLNWEDHRDALEAAVKAAGIAEPNPGRGNLQTAVYLAPGTVGDDGYPETAIVFTRDEHGAQMTVPYAALYPAGPEAAGRR